MASTLQAYVELTPNVSAAAARHSPANAPAPLPGGRLW
jgi:hypothetical protein